MFKRNMPGRRWLLPALLAILTLAGGAALSRHCAADDQGASPKAPSLRPLTPKELKAAQRAVKTVARKWATARRRLVGECATCQGSGVYRWVEPGIGGGSRERKCPHCSGGKRLYPKAHRAINHDLKSPAFRAQPGALDRLQQLYSSESRGRLPLAVKRVVAREVLVIDADHATVEFDFDNRKFTEVHHFIRSLVGTKRRWFVYDEAADGPWPNASAEAADEEVVASALPLTAQHEALYEAALADVVLHHNEESSAEFGRELAIVLRARGLDAGQLPTLIAEDACKMVRRLWRVGAKSPWTKIRWQFLAPYRNQFGAIDIKIHATASLDRPTFDKIVWDNLQSQEAFELFSPQWKRHSGWKIWKQ